MRIQAILLLGCLCALTAQAESGYFHVAPGKPTRVRFDSKARIERFSGQSDALSGWFQLDPDSLGALDGELVLDLADLDTGLALRNQHMRENVLETEQFPTAKLELERAEGATTLSDRPVKLQASGKLTLHGVTRDIVAEVEAHRQDGGIAFLASFEILLADYEIERPRMLMLRVAESLQLQVEGIATPGPAPKRTN